MYQHYSINDLLSKKAPENSEIEARGWVRTRRDSKAGISFIALHDGSCFKPLQIIAPNTLSNYEKDVLRLSPGAALIARGKLVKSPAKGQAFELQATEIEVTGFIDDVEKYPITPKHHTLEYLRQHQDLRIRTNTIGAAMRIANTLSFAVHRFFNERGFMWVRTPLITTSDCEGAGEAFRVTTMDANNPPRDDKGEVDFTQDFFGHEAFLTVSGQLNVETYCMAMSKVYTFGPAFRAENSDTPRHLAELWMVEPEIAFSDLNDLIKLAIEFVKYLAKAALTERADDMQFFAERVDKTVIERLEKMIASEFTIMEYTDAIKILEKAQANGHKFEFPVKWGLDLQSEHERYLTEKHLNAPMALINYPKDIKSFYMRVNEDNKTVAAMDILVPGVGEIMGGSQREERFEVLNKRMDELKMDKAPYLWYMNLRNYGTAKHAGFGLGFERLINYITGLANIRDVIPFPRTAKHAKF